MTTLARPHRGARPRPDRRTPVALLALAALLLGPALLSGCQPATTGAPVRVETGFYPLQFVAQSVGGDRVAVGSLAPPGVEPHDLEIGPQQLARIADADLVIYLRGFQPALDDAVSQEASDHAFDVTSAAPTSTSSAGGEATDPHIWLDPTRLARVGDALAERLAAADPPGATGYRERARALHAQLSQLDQQLRTGLAKCQRREIIVSHAAFGYLAARYQLNQIPITGLAPDAEPTPQRLAEVTAAARRYHATTIFYEALVSPAVAQTIADEVGAKTAPLDPIESAPGDSGDYLTAMRANLAALRTALGCA